MSKLLIPFGKIYGRAMDVRNRLYDRGTFRSFDLGARTISVGNLTTGGTGKTPLVGLIAEILAHQGETVCILTRGYGRKNASERVLVSDGRNVLVDAATGGDEPVELAKKLIGKAIIVADADRVAAGNWAMEQFGVTAFILDDGFQHRRVKRDLDIVCIDATDPCGNGRILPAGTLRESFKSLKRADAVVITRSDLIEDPYSIEQRLRKRNSDAPIFRAETKITGFVRLDNFFETDSVSENELPPRPFVFTAIGTPDNFLKTLDKAGISSVGHQRFRDHFIYDVAAGAQIDQAAKSAGASSLITTAKDAVKLVVAKFELPCYVAIAETGVDNRVEFEQLFTSS